MNQFFKKSLNRLIFAIWNIRKTIYRPHDHSIKVIVVGPPRAGTSFLTGLISLMGYNLGPSTWLKPADQHNPYGYLECIPLNRISNKILSKMKCDFHHPHFPGNDWTTKFNIEKEGILKIVNVGQIELYKDNKLMILSDIYYKLFPQAKWIFINRNVKETFKSRFGEELSFTEWQEITNKRMELWNDSRAAKSAFNINYQDFKDDKVAAIKRIANFLNCDLNKRQYQKCLNFFKLRR